MTIKSFGSKTLLRNSRSIESESESQAIGYFIATENYYSFVRSIFRRLAVGTGGLQISGTRVIGGVLLDDIKRYCFIYAMLNFELPTKNHRRTVNARIRRSSLDAKIKSTYLLFRFHVTKRRAGTLRLSLPSIDIVSCESPIRMRKHNTRLSLV